MENNEINLDRVAMIPALRKEEKEPLIARRNADEAKVTKNLASDMAGDSIYGTTYGEGGWAEKS